MAILKDMEAKMDNSLLTQFAGDKGDKMVFAQWLDKGVNHAKLGWALEGGDKKIVGTSMVLAGLATICSLTPAAAAIGAGFVAVGLGLKIMEKISDIGNVAQGLINRAKREMAAEGVTAETVQNIQKPAVKPATPS